MTATDDTPQSCNAIKKIGLIFDQMTTPSEGCAKI